jgi:hypothetical protein
MSNEVIPLYRPGNDITCKATEAVAGGTFVALSGALDGALPQVKPAAAGSRAFGVAARDSVSSDANRVPVIRGSKIVIPVIAGAAVAFGDEVEVGANGRAIKKASGVAVGRALAAGNTGAPVFIELF